jgi:hypothetical protein
MPTAYVVTEGRIDAEILKRCLPERLTRDVYITVGEGWSSAMSLAGSILVVKARPVALVVDADSEDEAAIGERRDFATSFLGRTSARERFEVFVAVPEFEAVLFQSKSVVDHLLGKPISDMDFEAAKHRPKKWLTAAGVGYPKETASLLGRLTEDDLAAIRSHALIIAVDDFLTRAIADNGSTPGRRQRVVDLH